MKRQGRLFAIIITCMIALVLLAGLYPQTALADSYTSTTMRLLRFEGNVEIEDASGKPRAVMENARLSSGESMKTAAASSASVGLDEGRIVTLDEKSRVEFKKQDGAVSMNLTEGKIFLDVSEKLGEGESMGVTTATMAIGIRGTIIYASCMPITDESAAQMESVDLKGLSPEKGHIVSISQIGVLEGTAQITYTDNSNRQQTVAVEAGKKATVPEYSEDAEGIPEPKVSDLTKEDIEGFVKNQVASSASVVDRVQEACDVADDIDITDLAGLYTADGDWTWDSPVTLIAQSASKYYDGQPLTRSSDILVDGLPSIFTVKASAGGSRTDAGESDNPVDNYAIFNKAGQDVTRHFTKLKTVSGTLLVVPAPLTIHTGTAEKVYDGTVLTEPDAYVTFYKGGDSREVPWRNTSYVVTEPAANVSYDNQTLYGICGVIWVNAANPLTGERREIQLKAGQKLTVFISDLAGKQSIELKIEKLTENDLPAELLRLYADNPALLEQACKDTGWNISLIRGRIEALPKATSGGATIEQGGLMIRESESDRLMQNLTNVRITVDTDITDYNNRALGSEEAHYSGLAVDESIKVTPTGRQTAVGTSVNTYTIDWGTADRSNYEVSEDLGTLTVTPASATITTGSASKTYDGTPLTNSEASISGLVAGETATVTATGTITEVGTTVNTYTIDWGTAAPGNYTISESLGTLRVTAAAPTPYGAVTLTAASASKTYDGTALTADSFTVSAAESLPSGSTANSEGLPSGSALNAEGLPSGFTVSATVSGSQTDVGSSANTITSYTIYDASGNDVTAQFPEVTLQSGTLTVNPAEVTITTGSAEKEYDGTPLTSSEASISGLVDGETATVAANGSITDVGSTQNTYTISWDSTDSGNYTISESLGTLQVTAQTSPVTLTAASVSKAYDGAALTSDSFTAEGLPSDFTVSVSISGSQTDAGNSANTIDSYTIYDLDGSDVTDYFSNITAKNGTLTVTPAEVTITTGSAEKEYDGTPLASSEASVSGLVDGETATVAASGSITDVGSTENTYSISWDSADSGNYTVSESLGTLRVTAQTSPVTLTAASADKIYDGTALTNSSVTAEGLPSGFTVSTTISGSQTDAGNSANTIDSYTIYNSDGKDVTDYFSNITAENGKLVVAPKEVTITTGSDDKEYDGTPLTNSEASISGLVSGETATVAANGSITEVGSTENTYSISWDSADSNNYTVTESLGTLAVNPLQVVFDVGFRGEEGPEIEDDMGGGGSGDDGSDSPAVFEYMGHPYFPEWILASYKGADEPVEPVDWDMDGETGTFSFTYTLPGGAKLQLNGTGYTNAGSYTLEPEGTFLEGNKDNYKITFINNSLEITPAALTITASASKEYDGEPLVGSNAVKIEGLADGDIISVTATGTITNAGTADNPYTVDWLETNPNNYTVTQEPGILEVTAKKVTITTGSAEKVYDGETLFYNNYELSPSDPWVNGQAPKITVTGSITNAGIKPNTCMVEWKGVNPNNYAVTQELGTLTVRPVDILLISNCQYGVSGTISILEYGLKAQVNNLESTRYEVSQMGENRWWLQFEWGDKVEVQIVVTIDETSYAITPVHDFILGDSGNYKISTQDQAGELDVPPIYPIDGFAMGKPSTFSIVADRSLAAVSELADTIISNHVDSPDDSDDEDDGQQGLDDEVEDQQELNDKVANQQELDNKAANQQDQQDSEEEKPVETSSVEAAAVEAAPAPIESSSDELIQDANQEDKDVPEEPSNDALPEPSLDEEDQTKPTEEEPKEEPSEGESQSVPVEEVLTDE